MKPEPAKNLGGRPPTDKAKRTSPIMFYVTEDDAVYLNEAASNMGFRSRSTMMAAIMERLCIGGFSGLSFIKLGWQFSNLPVERQGMYFGVRPFPPLIGDEDDPTGAEIVPFLKGINKQLKKENEAS